MLLVVGIGSSDLGGRVMDRQQATRLVDGLISAVYAHACGDTPQSIEVTAQQASLLRDGIIEALCSTTITQAANVVSGTMIGAVIDHIG